MTGYDDAAVPPQELAAEEALVGGLLLAGAEGLDVCAKVVRKVRATGLHAGDFYSEKIAVVYRACLEAVEGGKPADVLVVIDSLRRQRKLEEVGGESRVRELAMIASRFTNLEHFAEIIRRKARDRELIRTLGPVLDAARSGDLAEREADAALRDAISLIEGKREGQRPRVRSFAEIRVDYLRQFEPGGFRPIMSGLPEVDGATRGMSPGHMLLFAARNSVGKTAAINTFAFNVSGRDDLGILFVSLEQPDTEIYARMVAIHVNETPEEVEAWGEAGAATFAANVGTVDEDRERIRIADRPTDLAGIPNLIAEANDSLPVPVRLLLIDYAGLVEAPGRDLYQQVSAVARGMKLLAKEQQVAVVVATQINRAGGDGSEPVSAHMIRDSGAWEESADFIFGMWAPGMATNLSVTDQAELKNVVRVRTLKTRRAALTGQPFDLRFLPSRRIYQEVSPGTMPAEPDWRDLVPEGAA